MTDNKTKILEWFDKNDMKNKASVKSRYLQGVYDIVILNYINTDYTVKKDKVNKRQKYDKSVVFEGIEFIINNKNLQYGLDETTLKFLEQYKLGKYTTSDTLDWINYYGEKLLDKVFSLISSDELPLNIQERLFDQSLITKYTSLPVLQEVESNILDQHCYTVYFNNSDKQKYIPVKINTVRNKNFSYTLLDRIIRTILLLNKLHSNSLKDAKTSINIYLSNKAKKISNNKIKILGSDNINSGVTVFKYDQEQPVITTVYRTEELYKVIIHELVHNFKYDFAFEDININVSDYLNISPKMKLTPNESYTEVVALIISTMTESYLFDNCNNFRLFNFFLEYEIQFSLFQCAKILKFYGFKNTDDFFKPYDNLDRFKQHTNVFSYFFIKTALLVNFTNLIKFIEKNSDIFMLKKNDILGIKNEFTRLIDESLKGKKFKMGIAHYFAKLTSCIPELKNSLKMTLFS